MNPYETAKTPAEVDSRDRMAVAAWLVGHDTGASSIYMVATAIAGRVPPAEHRPAWPRDAADLGRCLRLIECAPSVATALPVLAECSPEWKALVEGWDELVRLHKDERARTKHIRRWTAVNRAMDRMLCSVNSEA